MIATTRAASATAVRTIRSALDCGITTVRDAGAAASHHNQLVVRIAKAIYSGNAARVLGL